MDPQIIVYIVVGGLAFLAGLLALLNLYIWYKEKHKRTSDEDVKDFERVHNGSKWDVPSFDDKRLETSIVDRLRRNMARMENGNLQTSSDLHNGSPRSDLQNGSNGSFTSVNMLFNPRLSQTEILPQHNGHTVTL